MADVTAGSQKALMTVPNGTDEVQISFIDDYSKMGLQVKNAAGAYAYYEVALVAR